jgi:calcineurin-like phosphoesterase family protein
MNKALTTAWNKTVGKKDRIYILGDLTMNQKKIPEYLLKLNGRKFYIPGNHDYRAEKIIRRWEEENKQKLVEEVSPLLTQKINKQTIVLCHYAMRTWSKSHYNSVQFYGHSHGDLPPEGRQLDIGVDNAYRLLGEYRPFSLDEALQFIPEHKPKNHH